MANNDSIGCFYEQYYVSVSYLIELLQLDNLIIFIKKYCFNLN